MPIFCVDAFTDRAFGGNPAAVCVLERPVDPAWMQGLAAEMNLSETAFVTAGAEGRWNLRWFTPAVEVDLCGHATLASAHTLWSSGLATTGSPIAFETRSGTLTATPDGERITLDFPAQPVHPEEPPDGLLDTLGAETATWTGRNHRDWLIEVADEATLRGARPDFARLRELGGHGFILTAAGEGEHDFVSRYFAPAFGIDEDPVTGSAHCSLGPYWAERLGKDRLTGFQASARGGVVGVEPRGERVRLSGEAVMVWRGDLAEGAEPR
jgi:PhzF family phenazine biosynthesis protein